MTTNRRFVRDVDLATLLALYDTPVSSPETKFFNGEMEYITVSGALGYTPIGRLTQSVAVNTAAGSTVGLDYVYFVSGTTTITLPTAVGNNSMYTIKNTGVGVVTIATTGGQTIDGSASVTLSVTNTSLDLISDNANWRIV
jgi:hypothetical protein